MSEITSKSSDLLEAVLDKAEEAINKAVLLEVQIEREKAEMAYRGMYWLFCLADEVEKNGDNITNLPLRDVLDLFQKEFGEAVTESFWDKSLAEMTKMVEDENYEV